jgi:hypothetical protein
MAAELVLAAYRPGHATARPAPLIRTERGELWRRKDQLAEYIGPRELAGAEVPFARWAVAADL